MQVRWQEPSKTGNQQMCDEDSEHIVVDVNSAIAASMSGGGAGSTGCDDPEVGRKMLVQEVRQAVREEQNRLHKEWSLEQEDMMHHTLRQHSRGLEQWLSGFSAHLQAVVQAEVRRLACAALAGAGAGASPSGGEEGCDVQGVSTPEGTAQAMPMPSFNGHLPQAFHRRPSMDQPGSSPGAAGGHARTPGAPCRRVRLPDCAMRHGSSSVVHRMPSCCSTNGAISEMAPDHTPLSRAMSYGVQRMHSTGEESFAPLPRQPSSKVLAVAAEMTEMQIGMSPAYLNEYHSEMSRKTAKSTSSNAKTMWRQSMKERLSKRLGSHGSYDVNEDEGRGCSRAMILLEKIWACCPSRAWSSRGKQPKSNAEAVVDSSLFQALSCSIISMNAIFIGVETDIVTQSLWQGVDHPECVYSPCVLKGVDHPEWMVIVNWVFVTLFVAELVLRMCVKGARKYFCGPDLQWNIFDFVTVSLSFMDLLVSSGGFEMDMSYTRILRGFRAIRILRVIRALRFLRELRLMVCSIAQSLVSFSWGLSLLLVVIYLFAICFMHAVDRYLEDPDKTRVTMEHLMHYYGSVPITMYSLMMAISGGENWNDLVQPLGEIHVVYKALFVFYIFFVIICVLNVLTSVFVQRANELVKLDRDLVIQCQLVSNENFCNEMKLIFEEADTDGTGAITQEKFLCYLQDENVQAYFTTHQLDTTEAHDLFDLMLDSDKRRRSPEDQDPVVLIEDFVLGCMRLRGQAKSSDVATLLRDSKRLGEKTMKGMRKIEKQLFVIGRSLSALPDMTHTSFFSRAFSPTSHWGGRSSPGSHYQTPGGGRA